MADAWVQSQLRLAIPQWSIRGPILDVGAGPYRHWWEPLFPPGDPYDTLDKRPLPGIDLVMELGDAHEHELHGQAHWPYQTLLLLSVLEHVQHPQAVIDWSGRQLAPGGYLVVAVPIAWPEHDHPGEDFWRFTPHGIRLLLAEFEILQLVTEVSDWDQCNQLFTVAKLLGVSDRVRVGRRRESHG